MYSINITPFTLLKVGERRINRLPCRITPWEPMFHRIVYHIINALAIGWNKTSVIPVYEMIDVFICRGLSPVAHHLIQNSKFRAQQPTTNTQHPTPNTQQPTTNTQRPTANKGLASQNRLFLYHIFWKSFNKLVFIQFFSFFKIFVN